MKSYPNKKIKKKNSSFFNVNTQIATQKVTSTFSAQSTINNTKNNSRIIPQKIETPIDFIKQKKKFNIPDFFDKNGTRDFIASKELALKEIKLNDEILFEENKETIHNPNTVSSHVYKKNYNDKKKTRMITENNVGEEENIKRNIETKKYRSEIKNSISKKKKSKYKNSDIYNSNFKKNKENNDKDNNILMIDKNSNDTKDSNFFYKFIIDNADESEEKFHKKLEKIKKKVEKKNQKNKKEKDINKALTIELKDKRKQKPRYNSAKISKKNDKENIFEFSEKAKLLMTNNGIEVSSISIDPIETKNTLKDDIYRTINNNIKLVRDKDNNKDNDVFFGEEENKILNNLNKDSIISILDDMV